MSYDFSQFLKDHKYQLLSSDIPEYFWYYLFFKLNEETYDISNVCELQLNEDNTEVDCVVKKSLMASNGENIFIIDNAWTFEIDKAKLQLKQFSGLRERIANMVGIDTADSEEDLVINSIIDNMWNHGRYYDLKLNSDESTKMWYMLDEAGTYIKHDSVEPAVRIVPFIYTPNGVCYSVAWLIKNVDVGDKLTVNRVEHIKDPQLKECISYIWTRKLPKLPENGVSQTMTPEFFMSHRPQESEPDMTVTNLGKLDKTKSQFSVYTDVSFVENSLKRNPLFKLTENKTEADILWLFDHFKDFEKLSKEQPQTMVNQFPSETVMTTKDLLAALGKDSNWIPTTFNLKTELAEFINHFNNNEEKFESDDDEGIVVEKCRCPCNCHNINVTCGVCSEDMTCWETKEEVGQVWIIKPWNLSRGLGIFISQNIDQILRMVEAYPEEPKIASRYITDPVLFYRSDLDVNVKFDIRYMVMLESVEPLRAYASKIFWLRFANKQFVLCNFDDYETHFTVMNYKENCQLKNINCDEFMELFESQYPDYKWEAVEREIHRTLRHMLEDVTRRPDPMRVRPSPQSRAIYAVDLMLEWDRDVMDEQGQMAMRPRLCEVNFCPDCSRAVLHHPDFFSDIFRTLFLDQPTNVVAL